MSNHPIKRRRSSKHHVKLGFVNPIIGLDVPSRNSSIDSKMVENIPISNPYLQVQHHLDYNQEWTTKSHELDKLIANKKSVMEIILDQCNVDTRAEIALSTPYEDDLKAGELIKFLIRLRKVCTNTEDKNLFFGSSVTRIPKHHFQPATDYEQLLAARPNDDANVDVTKESVATTITPMLTKDDEIWYNANGEYD